MNPPNPNTEPPSESQKKSDDELNELKKFITWKEQMWEDYIQRESFPSIWVMGYLLYEIAKDLFAQFDCLEDAKQNIQETINDAFEAHLREEQEREC